MGVPALLTSAQFVARAPPFHGPPLIPYRAPDL